MTKTIDFPVANRWSGKVQFTAKIDADESTPLGVKIGLAVRWAIKTGANLSDADLSGANLSYASLSGANLSSADLSGANLRDADLSAANLSAADLREADLREADLSAADLSAADLRDASLSAANLSAANLWNADLSAADLSGVKLWGVDLSGAGLPDEVLRPFQADLWMTLTAACDPNEVRFVIAALKAGAVDGSTYGEDGDCACLVGTMARFTAADTEERDHNPNRPAERWFMMIRPGDVPGRTDDDGKETGGGFAARKALEWTLAWCEAVGVDPEFPRGAEVPPVVPEAA